MSMSRRVRIACAIAGVGALIGAAGGITYAATTAATSTTASTYAMACTNVHHGLRFITSGVCPKGDSPIRLAVAPTPLTVNRTSGPRVDQTRRVGTFTFTASCFNDEGGTHSELDLVSDNAYDVQGTDVFVSGGGGGFSTPGGATSTNGAGQISYTTSTNKPSSIFNVGNNGGVTGSVEIIQSGHTITMTFALFAYNSGCSVQAQIAPSS